MLSQYQLVYIFHTVSPEKQSMTGDFKSAMVCSLGCKLSLKLLDYQPTNGECLHSSAQIGTKPLVIITHSLHKYV